MKKFYFIFIFIFILIAHPSIASTIREATDLVEGNISGPDVYTRQFDGKNFWIFTAPDSGGIRQVYYQWSDATTTATTTSPVVQLTNNSFNASKAKFGSEVNDLHYAPTAADPSTVCEGVVFYYLADSDSDGSKDIRMGCIAYSNMATEPTTVNFDVKLTGYDSTTNFDVKDYDVSRAGRATTLNIYSATSIVGSYPVVFTDSSNALHMLMFSKSTIYGNSDNISGTTPPILYDDSDPWSFLYVWNATTINTGAEYFNPVLDPWGNNILYSVKTSASPYKQLGTISITGRKQATITTFNRDVVNPTYHGDFHPMTTMANRAGFDVFFELRDRNTGSSRLVYLPVFYGIVGTMSWCNTAAYLTDTTYVRTNLKTDFGSSTDSDPETILLYEQEMPDGKHDLYQAKVNVSMTATGLYCNGVNTRADGTIMTFISTPIHSFYDLTKGVHDITKLTCMEDNTSAAFLQTIYHDADFIETTSGLDFMDVVFQRDFSDGSGEIIAHVYNTEVESETCDSNCFETTDGTPVVDINLFRDSDGIADSCENPTCQQLVNVDLYGDADTDGVANNRDNCPCDINSDQADGDSDHWGDVCDIEFDECGTTDSDADGVGDLCDACPSDADKTSLAYDNDGDGILDSCVSTNPCGSIDTDGDGIYDNCDACPSDAQLQALAYDIDGNGTNDSCVATPCGTTDTDGDGVFDNCDACPNNAKLTELEFDLDNNSINDSCVEVVVEVQQEANDPVQAESPQSGGFLVEGTLFCSLNTQAQANVQTTTQTQIWFGSLLGMFAVLSHIRHKQKHSNR